MNKKVTEYGLMITANLLGVEEAMEQCLADGWQPLGGLSCDGKLYIQSMIKYETNATQLPESL